MSGMGRHGGAPPRAAVPGRRASTTSAGVIVALVAATAAVLTVLGVTLAGVPLLPRPDAVAASPTPTATPSIDVVALASSPAQKVIATVLGAAPAKGWTPAGTVSWSGGTPFDAACGRPASDAALSGARVYGLGRAQVVLTVSAYTAGSGAVAMADWAKRLGACPGAPVTVTPVTATGSGASGAAAAPALGRDAFVATLARTAAGPGASVLFWRHGDVVAIVASPSPVGAGLPALAAVVDPALVAALVGVCSNPASTVADAVRSPWVSREQFLGLTAPVTVTVAPSPAPVPPTGVTPVPTPWTPSPLPSVSIPVRPADPVWPSDVPAELVSPSPPSALAAAPVSSVVPSRLPDPVGPGCGWAFTGQVAPPYDAATEALLAQDRVTAAQQDLATQQQAWQSDVVAYWQAVAAYDTEATSYAAYAAAVREVARAWDRITAQRQAYSDAVAAYNDAAAARQQFLLDQAAAQTAYDDAVAACAATGGPTSTATPTDTATPTSSVTASPTGSGGGCPPPVPVILGQTAPTVPPLPTPPPDPRPTG